jgi:A/G-specific adenine glycosylase
MNKQAFHHNVLNWHQQHGRHDLPWQHNINSYRVLVSEVMLQQTQVNTVIPYFERFMQQFPNIKALAQASEDEVLHLWTGLGYYRRAKNLHRCAQQIMQDYAGKFPTSLEDAITLPGLGRSTASAVLAIAQALAILDGNVKRVLCRHDAIAGWAGKSSVNKQLWALAEKYTPKKKVAQYTQAIMDLGATVCTTRQAQCQHCPVQHSCQAYKQQTVDRYPEKAPRQKIPKRSADFFIFKHHHHVLLKKRPDHGIWAGLWCFPDNTELSTQAEQTIKADHTAQHKLSSFTHVFSHFQLKITPVIITLQHKIHRQHKQYYWHSLKEPLNKGTARPMQTILQDLGATL